MSGQIKLFSDPVHGFISVSRGLILDLIETPEFQRLRRIRQLGLGFLVFPGAVHSRFEHALGAMALMQEVLETLREKGTEVSDHEFESALAATLLHDIGHGPFSHTLEKDLLPPGSDGLPHRHEAMSRAIINKLNDDFNGALELALAIFDGTYDRPFFHTLVASQLDMDRLDYLRRDSFYTGVAEGMVGVERMLKTMRVKETEKSPRGRIVIEAKGAYSVEHFILSRRLMFWQVYLHKTVLAADHLLLSTIRRARQQLGAHDPAIAATSPALAYFLSKGAAADDVNSPSVIAKFAALDDSDILYSIKRWQESPDPILADLAQRFTDRNLFRTVFLAAESELARPELTKQRVVRWLLETGLSNNGNAEKDVDFYFSSETIHHDAYQNEEDVIAIMEPNGTLRELSVAENMAAVSAVTGSVERSYICAPKEVF